MFNIINLWLQVYTFPLDDDLPLNTEPILSWRSDEENRVSTG